MHGLLASLSIPYLHNSQGKLSDIKCLGHIQTHILKKLQLNALLKIDQFQAGRSLDSSPEFVRIPVGIITWPPGPSLLPPN